MRLGAYIMQPCQGAEEYIQQLLSKKYRAAYCPEYLKSTRQQAEIKELRQGLQENDIILAEVGTWVNPLSPNKQERERAIAYIIERLALADELRARCCVNVIGSLSGEYWYAPCAANFTDEFWDASVSTYQRIIDEVKPKHTRMTFEIMPYSLLDDVEGYLHFLNALNRPNETAVHLDVANLIHDPRTLYAQHTIWENAFDALGPKIASVHMKDLHLDSRALNTQLIEVMPGQGQLDLKYVFQKLYKLSDDLPVMLEHLPDEASYDAAMEYIALVASKAQSERAGSTDKISMG